VYEKDREVVLSRSRLDDRIVLPRTEHPTRGAKEEFGPVFAEAPHDVRDGPVGADQDSHAAVGRLEHGRLLPGGIAHSLVPQLLLAVFADELPLGGDEHRRVEAGLAVGFQHPGHEVDPQFARQGRQLLVIRSARDRLAEGPIRVQRDRLVGDGIAVEKALGGADDLRPAGRGFADHGLDPPKVGLLIGADPLQHDPCHADRRGPGLRSRPRLLFCEGLGGVDGQARQCRRGGPKGQHRKDGVLVCNKKGGENVFTAKQDKEAPTRGRGNRLEAGQSERRRQSAFLSRV